MARTTPQHENMPAVPGPVRTSGTVLPDRLYVRAPGYKRNQTRLLANQSAAFARALSPKLSGRGAQGIKPYYGDGFFGVKWDRSYIWYQEVGINPFTMLKLAGKAQPLDEMVLTPIGWQKMGAIEVGSQVIGANGHPTTVRAVFPQGTLDCYRVTFSDGSIVCCSADHLWTVRRSRSGAGQWEVRTTEYIAERLQAGWRVPLVHPIWMEELDLPLDPYLVGVFLGDGCLTGSSPTFSASGDEVPRQVKALLPDLEVRKARGENHSWTITAGRRGTRANPLSEVLRRVGINGLYSWEKFIPAAYMAGSPQSREALLQGLMDTDGSCSKDGCLKFFTCSPMLAENVADLVRGLGGYAKVSSEDEGRHGRRPMHTVALRLPTSIFPFRAELERKRRYSGSEIDGKGIVSIEWDGEAEMQCLLVEAEDSLYVTAGYTLTHNTIPMWIDDPTGAEHRANPKAKTRITESGRRQVLIFRKAAKPGERKRVAVRDRSGRLRYWRDVPKSYPGAPGRISHRGFDEVRSSTTGRIAKLVSRPHVGVRWRHPGLVGREFMQYAIQETARLASIPDPTVYAVYRRR